MNKKQLESLQKIVDRQLELRCIKVETKLEVKEHRNGYKYVKLSSTNFQTIPVIHFDLSVSEFGGSITPDKEHEGITNIWLPVHVEYDGNGVKLFVIHAYTCHDDLNEVHVKSISH